jgi:predicted permease
LIPFDAVLAALVPVFVLILAGHVMKRTGFPGDGFWEPAVASIRLGPLVLVLAGSWLAVALGLLLLRRWLVLDGPAFTSVMQGGIRFNTYVGLAAAAALFGADGLTLAAVVIAVMVPLINVLCVTTLSRYGEAARGGWKPLLRGLAGNPLILACVAGITLNLSGIGLPWGSDDVLEIIGRASLPLGLLAVGAGLDAGAIRGRRTAVATVSAVKLVALAVLFAALPTAPSAYILARQMGGDAHLMAGLLTLQTVMAVLTLPLAIALLA